jgi:hypothetical protein
MHDQAGLYSGLATLVVLGLIVRRTLTTQTVRVWALVVVPVIVLVAAARLVAVTPPTDLTGYGLLALGALAGAALGYARGMHTKAQLGPRPGTLVVQGSVVLVVILVAAFALRFAMRALVGTQGPLGVALSDGLLVFAAVSVAVARGMLLFAWRRLDRANRTTVTAVA